MRLAWMMAGLALAAAAQTQRGVGLPQRPVAAGDNGAYYALVIGIDHYPHWPELRTAAGDARSMDAVLRQRYGFRTQLLVDAAATRANILKAFADYRRDLRDNDNLVIYYAGHGARDGEEAYWLPYDSDPDSQANWIIATELTKGIQVMPARHVLVISDSCYSGGLTRAVNANTATTDRANYLRTMLASKSRVLISSGRDEPVADSGSGGHSVFANALLTGLQNMPENEFSASNLFTRYVQEAVAGGSKQVPLYQMIQDSGHEYGDFVFEARSGPGGASPPPAPGRGTTPSRSPSAPPAASPHQTSLQLLADGRSNRAGTADPSGALPLTNYRVALLEFRDLPQTLSDAYLADIAKFQINGEQKLRKAVDAAMAGSPPPGVVLNPQKPMFVFSWQKEMETNPAFAASALLPIFLRPDPDWSFLKNQPGWDERYDSYVYVYVFDHDKIQGREPEFVAREMVPVIKKQILAAVGKAATHLYLDVRLNSRYDISKGAVVLSVQDGGPPVESLDVLRPMNYMSFAPGRVENLAAPADREYHTMLPAAARTTANYMLVGGLTDTPEARPGVILYGFDPGQMWRKDVAGNTFDMRAPPLGGFALDRQVKIGPIPMEPAKAEPLRRTLQELHARVYFSVQKMELFQLAQERQWKPAQGLMFAHVEKVEILGPKDEGIATIPAAQLPAVAGK